MSLSFVLVGSQIKRFKTVVKSLAAIGSELLVEALPEKLVLRAINSAHSAFLAVSLSSHFFESYNVFSQRGVVQAGVLIKHLLATFRSTRVSSMSCELNEEQVALRVVLRCDNGLIKRYGLDINSTDILQANLDSATLPVSVVAEAAELNKLLNTFQSTLDEVSIIALPAQQSTAGTGPQGQAAAQRCVKLQSFYDPAKAAGSKALHTSMSLDTSSVFKSYSNSCSAASDVTVNLKDLKALVGLCVELGADVVLKFDEAGVPLLAVPHAPGVQAMDYTAELILSTLQESVHAPDDPETDWQQGAAAAAAAGGQPNGVQQGAPAAAAAAVTERAETIAPATTMMGGAAAAAHGDTPQGGVGGRGAAGGGGSSVLRFRPAPAPSAAAAAAGSHSIGVGGGMSGGGRSGGRARSGGVSRFEQLEAALAEEEAHQRQQQQYFQQERDGGSAAAAMAMGASAGHGDMAQQQQQQQQQQSGQTVQQQWGQTGAVGVEGGAAGQGGLDGDAMDTSGAEGVLQHSLGSLDDIEALPGHSRRYSRSPAAPAAGAGAAAAANQYQQPWGHLHQPPPPSQQQQQEVAAGVQPGGFGSAVFADEGAGGGQHQGGEYGGAPLPQLDDDAGEGYEEELPATPPGASEDAMEDDGLGEL